jgi:hypothetical protein
MERKGRVKKKDERMNESRCNEEDKERSIWGSRDLGI